MSDATVETGPVADHPTSLADLLGRSVETWGDRPALVTTTDRYTYRELADLVDRYARALVSSGAAKGSRVAILMENDPDWVALALAATSIGALLVPVSTFVHTDDLRYQLAHADVEHLVMSASFLGNDYLKMLVEIAPGLDDAEAGRLHSPGLPHLRNVIVRGGDDLPVGCRAWDDFVASADDVPASVTAGLSAAVNPEDDCYLLTTSGTTARPKGVLHTHRSIAVNGSRIGDYQGLLPEDVVWFYFPLFFSAGCINVMLGTLSHGATLLLQPNLDVDEALVLIEREGATTWHLWPHQLKLFMEHPDWATRDHSGLHKGTAPYDILCESPPEDGLGGVNMYGMTETATAFSCTGADESLDIRMNTQGHLLAGNEMKVVDPDSGDRVPTGDQGELCVKGPSVMRGYYKVDPATTFDSEGFFHTGDLGFFDNDGRVHFVQRLKDVIKTGGINVSPADIEASLSQIEGVRESHVFALPSDDKGEVVGAALVPEADAQLAEAAVREYFSSEMAGYKRPQAVMVVAEPDIPMTGSGKVQKHVLRERMIAALDEGRGPFIDQT